ncbi:protein Aster-B isoform X3 [Pangasianodon hypophthalmus]|uniref:protein Aster-B isoform X3 n=1 Tax=Pangasianodon hypophthalmus TaxID=310915 RepID=UPI002307A7DF|nr:protein Aster-B isoform X3 [Pangasianodon hypophthalmus]
MSYTGHGRIIPLLHVQEEEEEGKAPKTSSSSSLSSSSSSLSRNRSCTAGTSTSTPRRHHSSQQSSLQSSHEDDSARYLSPNAREDSTASNSTRSTPTCSPVLRKRSRSPVPPSADGENMVEKSSDHSSDKSPSTPEQTVQRPYSQSVHSTRTGNKNSKKSQSWYNVLSPTYKQRNEDFRKLFKQLPDTERLIVDYSCALQRDILLQGRLYLSENWICFYSNIFRWETLLMVRLKDVCSMTKEKTARLIPNAIQLCTDNEKHFFTSFGARDRTYMMMFRLWQNALLDKPLCPKELWHFVHQCYGNELGLTSDDEDYVPPDDDFNTMGCCPPPWCRYCEEIPPEENEAQDTCTKSPEVKMDASPQLPKKSFTSNNIPSTGSGETPGHYDVPPEEEFSSCLPEDLLSLPLADNKLCKSSGPAPSPSLDFNDNEDLPTELSDSSETHDDGEVQAFHDDLNGKQYINEVYKFSVDKLYDLLFTESQFMRDFLELRRFSDVVYHPWKKEEMGDQSREIMYTISITNPLAPKTATVTETQTLYKASQEGECYIVDAEVITHDVPYHDYFYTLNRYMLTRVAKNKCRLRVSTELRYRKQPWGLVKGFIERNFWSGLDEYFRHLELELSKVEVVLNEPHRPSPKAKVTRSSTVRRHRKRAAAHLRPQHLDEELSAITTAEDDEVIQRIKHVPGSTQTRHLPDPAAGGLALYSVSKLLLIISFVLVLLVFLNMMLFYKLWTLEHTTQSLASLQGLRARDSKLPQTQMEWAQLLESQQRYHDDELEKWREIIKSSVVLLDEMRGSLLNLQKGIGMRDDSSAAEDKRNRYH